MDCDWWRRTFGDSQKSPGKDLVRQTHENISSKGIEFFWKKILGISHITHKGYLSGGFLYGQVFVLSVLSWYLKKIPGLQIITIKDSGLRLGGTVSRTTKWYRRATLATKMRPNNLGLCWKNYTWKYRLPPKRLQIYERIAQPRYKVKALRNWPTLLAKHFCLFLCH